MKFNSLFLFIFLLFAIHQITAQDDSIIIKKDLSIGEAIEIKSKILNENRLINIYLPNGYCSDSTKTYPVIYLLDGSIHEDLIHIVGLVQFCSFPWLQMIPESIVVGISNVDRKRDYSFPSSNRKERKKFPTAGGSEHFINFIEKELQPLIEKNYNVSSDKTIIGQSAGGLLASEILIKKPNLFDRYIIVSPSLWWDKESLLDYDAVPFKSKKSIYIAVGKEGKVMERTAKELYEKVKAYKNESTIMHFEFLENYNHANILHVAVYSAIQKLYSKE